MAWGADVPGQVQMITAVRQEVDSLLAQTENRVMFTALDQSLSVLGKPRDFTSEQPHWDLAQAPHLPYVR